MKNLLLLFFLLTGASAFGQMSQPADSSATLYGLPVLKSYVAPDVVERAKKKYGRSLYSIEKSTAAGCQNSYLVGLIRNGHLTLEWMCDDPKIASQPGTKKSIYPSLRTFFFAKEKVVLNGQEVLLFGKHKPVGA
jgi:hypothetical protein